MTQRGRHICSLTKMFCFSWFFSDAQTWLAHSELSSCSGALWSALRHCSPYAHGPSQRTSGPSITPFSWSLLVLTGSFHLPWPSGTDVSGTECSLLVFYLQPLCSDVHYDGALVWRFLFLPLLRWSFFLLGGRMCVVEVLSSVGRFQTCPAPLCFTGLKKAKKHFLQSAEGKRYQQHEGGQQGEEEKEKLKAAWKSQ